MDERKETKDKMRKREREQTGKERGTNGKLKKTRMGNPGCTRLSLYTVMC
jgi:hypothetical protein